jgi:hypothetical protein
VVESFDGHGPFYGTIFDARFTNTELLRVSDFDAATEVLGDRSVFIGVHQRGPSQAALSAEWLARTLARIRGHAGPFLTTRDHVAYRARDTPRTRDPLGIARSLAEEEGFVPGSERSELEAAR